MRPNPFQHFIKIIASGSVDEIKIEKFKQNESGH